MPKLSLVALQQGAVHSRQELTPAFRKADVNDPPVIFGGFSRYEAPFLESVHQARYVWCFCNKVAPYLARGDGCGVMPPQNTKHIELLRRHFEPTKEFIVDVVEQIHSAPGMQVDFLLQ